jgi:hypothetical protein
MQLDATRSADLKADGMQRALDFAGDWHERVLLELRGWCAIERARGLSTMTVEQFRTASRNQPASHKAWGALPRLACAAGIIEPKFIAGTDQQERVRAASPKTHAHEVKVWRILA